MIIIESIKNPSKLRFKNTPKLLHKSRINTIAFGMRCSYLLALIPLYILGKIPQYYIYYVIFVLIAANLGAAIFLSISCGLRNLMSRVVYKEDNFYKICHPVAMGYIFNILPIWVFSDFAEYISISIIVLVEFFYAKKTTTMKTRKVLTIFSFTRLILWGLAMWLRYLKSTSGV